MAQSVRREHDPLYVDVIENTRVIVGEGTVQEQAPVVVTGDSILPVTTEPVAAPAAQRIDAAGHTVLPGLIDAHRHLLLKNLSSIPQSDGDLDAYIREELPGRLQAYLEAGITTVMSTVGFCPAIRDVRNRIQSDDLKGPRVFTSDPEQHKEDIAFVPMKLGKWQPVIVDAYAVIRLLKHPLNAQRLNESRKNPSRSPPAV